MEKPFSKLKKYNNQSQQRLNINKNELFQYNFIFALRNKIKIILNNRVHVRETRIQTFVDSILSKDLCLLKLFIYGINNSFYSKNVFIWSPENFKTKFKLLFDFDQNLQKCIALNNLFKLASRESFKLKDIYKENFPDLKFKIECE